MDDKKISELVAKIKESPELAEKFDKAFDEIIKHGRYGFQVERIMDSEPYTESEKAAHIEYIKNL